MASIQFTQADRDARGFVKAAEPRSLADLLPSPESIKQNAARPARQKLRRNEIGALTIVSLMAIFIIVYAWGTPSAPTQQIERAIVMPPTMSPARPTAAPTASPVRLLAAFDQPAGRVLGTIEETRPYTPTAHYGGDWVQADVSGSGRVWLRAGDLPSVALTGPDLAPKAAPPVEAPAVWNPPAPAVEVAPTLPPTVLAVFHAEPNGQKAAAGGDWCRGAHLDDPECQESRDVDHGQKVQQ